jgi:proliferating cell nuclear antigen
MGFKVRIANAKFWKDLIGAVSAQVDEATFDLKPEGVSLRAMDPSHVTMVDMNCPKDMFEEYSCEKVSKLCISLSNMLKLIRGVSADESLGLSLDEEKNQLEMRIEGRYSRTLKIPILGATGEEAPEPRLEFDAEVKMLSSFLRQALTDAGAVSDHVRLEAIKDKFVISATGEAGSVSSEFVRGCEALLELDVRRDSTALFTLEYLNEIVKAAVAASEVVSIAFSTDKPVKLDFELPGKEAYLRFYIAPRLE